MGAVITPGEKSKEGGVGSAGASKFPTGETSDWS